MSGILLGAGAGDEGDKAPDISCLVALICVVQMPLDGGCGTEESMTCWIRVEIGL